MTISSIELAEKVVELEVAERVESKHLPVEIQIGQSNESVPKPNSSSHTEKQAKMYAKKKRKKSF